jgi:hypothetical protein
LGEVFEGSLQGSPVAIKRVALSGGWQVRHGKLQGAVEEVNFGIAVAKAVASPQGAELDKHLCYRIQHRESAVGLAPGGLT